MRIATDTFIRSCTPLLFLMADSDAVMRSSTGICSGVTAKFGPLARTSFSALMSSLLDNFSSTSLVCLNVLCC